MSFPPFLLEVFLFGPINEEKSEARIGDGVAVFTLQKRRDELWDQLFTNIGTSFILSLHFPSQKTSLSSVLVVYFFFTKRLSVYFLCTYQKFKGI